MAAASETRSWERTLLAQLVLHCYKTQLSGVTLRLYYSSYVLYKVLHPLGFCQLKQHFLSLPASGPLKECRAAARKANAG